MVPSGAEDEDGRKTATEHAEVDHDQNRDEDKKAGTAVAGFVPNADYAIRSGQS